MLDFSALVFYFSCIRVFFFHLLSFIFANSALKLAIKDLTSSRSGHSASAGTAVAKKASEESGEVEGTSFLGGIRSASSCLASSLVMTQEAVAVAWSSVPGSSAVSEGVLDFSLARA